jgi:hypothetical protein
VDKRVLSCVICLWILATACGGGEGKGGSHPRHTPQPEVHCIEASADSLPYSFCVPDTWVADPDVIHSDGSIDIAMRDEMDAIVGSATASGPVEPSGRVNTFAPFPTEFSGAQQRKRFLASVGFEPKAVDDMAVEALVVDGHAASLLTLTLDIGEPEALTRVFELRVSTEGRAGIELLFVFGASHVSDDVIRQVISTVSIDAALVEDALEAASATDV